MTAGDLTEHQEYEFEALGAAENYRKALMQAFNPWLRASVLEIGAGVGHFTALLRESPAIQRLMSVEPCSQFCDRLRAQFPDHRIVHGTVADVSSHGAWDSILSINVLEHIEDDAAELATYRRLLAPRRGSLSLFVPARPEIMAPIDRDFGHFRRYMLRGLRQKLTRAGFKVETLHYYNFIGYFAWWVSFCLLRRRSFEIEHVRFFDRHVFPVLNTLELEFARPPLGQSLLAVAVT